MLKKKIINHNKVINSLVKQKAQIKTFIDVINFKLKKGGKIFFCGNGGSAADAQHYAAELLIRLRSHISRKPIPAISLATDTSTLTACSNDFRFEDIFVRPFLALSNKNDVLFVISTSGNSKNIVQVLKAAKKKKITSLALLGNLGGEAKKYSDNNIIVASKNTALIQEAHIFLGHYILEMVEDKFLK